MKTIKNNKMKMESSTKMFNSTISTMWTIFVILTIFSENVECFAVKKSASPELNSENFDSGSERLTGNYDEYPMIVPKRAAMLLDRLLVALHHALEDGDEEGMRRINDLYKDSRHTGVKNPLLNKELLMRFRGNENNMNYYEVPIQYGVANDLKQIEGRHSTDDMMGLQRRGHDEELGKSKARSYWRCYFNAVTCF